MTVAIVIGIIVVVLIVLILVFAIKSAKPHEYAIWSDRKRTFLGLPWSFTMYELTKDRIFIQQGVLTVHEEEIRLYRILDITYEATLGQRLFGCGSIKLVTSDKTSGDVLIESVKDARNVKEQIAKAVEADREKNHVYNREMIGAPNFGPGPDDGFEGPDDMGGGEEG